MTLFLRPVCTPNWVESMANGSKRRIGKSSKIDVLSKCPVSFKFLERTQFAIKMIETLIQKMSMNILSENIALIILLQTISEKKLNRIRQLRLMTLHIHMHISTGMEKWRIHFRITFGILVYSDLKILARNRHSHILILNHLWEKA